LAAEQGSDTSRLAQEKARQSELTVPTSFSGFGIDRAYRAILRLRKLDGTLDHFFKGARVHL
jgi:hypothetical protein